MASIVRAISPAVKCTPQVSVIRHEDAGEKGLKGV